MLIFVINWPSKQSPLSQERKYIHSIFPGELFLGSLLLLSISKLLELASQMWLSIQLRKEDAPTSLWGMRTFIRTLSFPKNQRTATGGLQTLKPQRSILPCDFALDSSVKSFHSKTTGPFYCEKSIVLYVLRRKPSPNPWPLSMVPASCSQPPSKIRWTQHRKVFWECVYIICITVCCYHVAMLCVTVVKFLHCLIN